MAGHVLISKGTFQTLFKRRHHEKRAFTQACESGNMEKSLLNSGVNKKELSAVSHSPEATSNGIPVKNWVAWEYFEVQTSLPGQ